MTADASLYEGIIAHALAEGAFRAAAVDVEKIETDTVFREMCASNVCGNYGRCWMCPPDVGEIDDLMAELKTYDTALVYQSVGQLEDSYDFEGMMDAAAAHNRLTQSMRDYVTPAAFGGQFPKILHLGAGGCHVCETCAKKTGEPCRFPEKALPSLEAYGVNVSKLAAAAGMKYINGQNTVTYFGAVLLGKGRRRSHAK